MPFTPAAIPTREPKKLATTTITNELAVAFNQSLGLGQTGEAGSVLHRAVVMYAKITGVYNNRDGYYNAKSITQPKTLNVKSTTDLTESDLGVVSKNNDLILTNPSEVVTSQALSANDIVPFELIGETADGKGFGRILSNTGGRIIARISGNTRDGSNWRWTYSFVQVEKTAAGFGGWTDKSGGLTGTNTLRNLIEDQNGTTAGGGVLGNGVDVDNLSGLTPQPIPTGTRIEIWPVTVGGATEWWCQYENGIDGTCA